MKHFFLTGKLTAGLLLLAATGCSQTAKVSAPSAASRIESVQTAPTRYRVEKDLSYYPPDFPVSGDSAYAAERCKLDLYIPEKITKPVPVLIYFHGGGLSRGGKRFPPSHIPFPAEFILVFPNYRLSGPRAKCPAYLNDAAAAAAWTVRNIQQYGGNPRQIFISGASGGGYLAAMVGMDSRWLKPHGLDPRKCFAGILPVSGQMSTHFQILKERGLEGKTVIDEFAPIYHAAADTAPIVLFCGQSEIEWPSRVAENEFFHAVLTQRKKHPDVRIYRIDGFNHSQVTYPAAHLLRKEMKRIIQQQADAEKSVQSDPKKANAK